MAREAKPNATGEACEGRAIRILLAEDQEPVRRLLVRQLETLGYQVAAATDGQEAIEMFEAAAGSIDLLMTDMTMPHLSGDELARKLRQSCPQLPVLFVSGLAVSRSKLDDTPGRTEHIVKPFKLNALAGVLRSLLGDEA